MKLISQYSGWMRQLRILHWLNNLSHRKDLLPNREIYRRLGIRRSVLRTIDSRVISRFTDITDPGLINKLPAHHEELPLVPLNINWHEAMHHWNDDGYMHLNQYISKETIDAINSGIEEGIQNRQLHYNYTGRKIFNAQDSIPAMKAVTSDPGIMAILHHLFGRPAVHFQTISFTKGSEQAAHSDSVHMTTIPLGYLAGVWIALEDIHSDNGPLTYFPGSHKLPYILNKSYGNSSNALLLDGHANKKYEEKVREAIAEHGLEERRLSAKAGDVFIWQANLLHGGAAINDENATRKSMVSHYFAKDVLCFHEISERPAILK